MGVQCEAHAGAGAGEGSEFRPRGLYVNPHVQSVLASSRLRRPLILRRAAAVLAASSVRLLDAGEDIRLLAWHAPRPPGERPRGLAVLIHGWEGSGESLYLLAAAARLYLEGWSVLRLNLRDHGPSHHLNRDLFHSNRITEVVAAVASAAREIPDRPLVLGGFSLGGNFAMRVAVRATSAGIPLSRAMAVCPVLDPAATLVAMEDGPRFYQRHFMVKWRRSLEIKARCFPGCYDFGDLRRFRGLRDMTEHFVLAYSDYPDLDTYLAGYALVGETLRALDVPCRLVAAEDDPVIPVADLDRLAPSPSLDVCRTRYGGHCGYLTAFAAESWVNDELVRWFGRAAAE